MLYGIVVTYERICAAYKRTPAAEISISFEENGLSLKTKFYNKVPEIMTAVKL